MVASNRPLLENPSPQTLYMREYLRKKPEKRRDQAVVAERKRQRKLELVKLKGGKCVDCGYNAHPAALQFDHRPGVEKLFNLGHRFACAWNKQVAEAEKCDLVCANCHSIRTYTRGQYSHPRES